MANDENGDVTNDDADLDYGCEPNFFIDERTARPNLSFDEKMI